MGTSKSYKTPSGGGWTSLKANLTQTLHGERTTPPSQILGQTMAAAGGFAGNRGVGSSGLSGAPASGGSGRAGSRRGAGGTTRRTAGKALTSLTRFASTVQKDGLQAGLKSLGIEELKGRSAPEVIARISDHLSEISSGTDKEILARAVQESIVDAVSLGDDTAYEDLEKSLSSYLSANGIEGLIELFLVRYVFNFCWVFIEDHVQRQSATDADVENMQQAIRGACLGEVRALIQETRDKGRFEKIDWFGREGATLSQRLVNEIEARLMVLKDRK